MASKNLQYPGYLNPFGDVEDEAEDKSRSKSKPSTLVSVSEYPDHLDPFGDDDAGDDYDDSLNPFGDEAVPDEVNVTGYTMQANSQPRGPTHGASNQGDSADGNPFTDDGDGKKSPSLSDPKSIDHEKARSKDSPSPDLVEPPKPLPRTKSLLKKEQAHKKRLQEQQVLNTELQQAYSLQSTTSSTTSSSSTATDINPSSTIVGSSQRRKRLAPPVPVNFKRQVSGSLDAIEEELNGLGDKLAVIDKESTLCQKALTANGEVDEVDLDSTKTKFAELIKRRNSIVRRQKELMYKKRELKLDQLHSDIEYELRMIGNKQLSTRTEGDEIKEKELLKKLVEIVEEKNDIVENLNKDTSCDSRDVEEALRRLNIVGQLKPEDRKRSSNMTAANTITTTMGPSTTISTATTTKKNLSKKESCDKSGLAKLSKIATLLPKSNTIKLKRITAKQLDFESQEGKPCICNSTFYRFCPPANDCLENIIPDTMPSTTRGPDPRDKFVDNDDFTHDDFDPDHVSDLWQLPPQINDLADDLARQDRAPSDDRFVGDSERERQVLHRKVYLEPINRRTQTIANAINIRIPVKVPMFAEPSLPTPKPIYKMKKYVTYERVPEVVNIPVKKTIIKPVGVSPDQIIKETPTEPFFFVN